MPIYRHLTTLTPNTLAAFRTRFGDGGDGLIRRVEYDFARQAAEIVLTIATPAEGWVNLRLSLDGVSAWRAAHTNESHHQVLSDGFSVMHAEQWHLDLAPDFAQAPSPAVIRNSAFYFVAQGLEFEVLPYDYPGDR